MKCGMKKQISRSKWLRVVRQEFRRTKRNLDTSENYCDGRWVGFKDKQVVGHLYRRMHDQSKPIPECFTYYRYDLTQLK